NDDLDVGFSLAATSERAAHGTVWRRMTQVGDRIVIHLVNLCGQPDTLWDAARAEPGNAGIGTLDIRRLAPVVSRVLVADPDGAGHLVELAPDAGGDGMAYTLPPLNIWQMVVVELRS